MKGVQHMTNFKSLPAKIRGEYQKTGYRPWPCFSQFKSAPSIAVHFCLSCCPMQCLFKQGASRSALALQWRTHWYDLFIIGVEVNLHNLTWLPGCQKSLHLKIWLAAWPLEVYWMHCCMLAVGLLVVNARAQCGVSICIGKECLVGMMCLILLDHSVSCDACHAFLRWGPRLVLSQVQ